eukprot:m.502499 g.502499  ORF g.502499 m.502499 type:complete len:340 (+) comp57338_c0_seq15:54-1073(+)
MHRLVAVAAAVCAVLLVSTVHAQATGWVLGAPGEISCARVCRNTGLASMQFINTPERFVYLNAHFRTPNCTSFYNCTCDFAPAIHPPTGTCYFNYCGTSKVEANPATITGNYSRLQRYCCCNPRGCISQPSYPPPLSKWNFSFRNYVFGANNNAITSAVGRSYGDASSHRIRSDFITANGSISTTYVHDSGLPSQTAFEVRVNSLTDFVQQCQALPTTTACQGCFPIFDHLPFSDCLCDHHAALDQQHPWLPLTSPVTAAGPVFIGRSTFQNAAANVWSYGTIANITYNATLFVSTNNVPLFLTRNFNGTKTDTFIHDFVNTTTLSVADLTAPAVCTGP